MTYLSKYDTIFNEIYIRGSNIMKIIAVNAGSSSLKFQLLDMPSENVLVSGIVERIGQEISEIKIKLNGDKLVEKLPIKDHSIAVELLSK
jgi:acetate kinase